MRARRPIGSVLTLCPRLLALAPLFFVPVPVAGAPQPPSGSDFSRPEPAGYRAMLPAVRRGHGPPDLIFHNGTVLTMEAGQPQASAIAITGDSIVAVGDQAQVLALKGPATRVIDLGGRTLMPGFVDPHTHLLGSAGETGLENAQYAALASGITSLGEAYCDPALLARVKALDKAGGLRVRTSLYLAYTNGCGEVQGDWYKQHPQKEVCMGQAAVRC